MADIVTNVATQVGIEESKAKKAVGLMLAFLKKEGPSEPVGKLLAALPNSEALIADAGSPGMFGMGGLMGLGGQLMGLGLSMGQVQSLSRALFAEGKTVAGEETMGAIVAGVPGLGQFV